MMGRMKELSQILDGLVDAGTGLIEAADALREYLSSGPEETTEERKALTKEDVRRLLVAKSNLDDGAYKQQVKALVRKYSESGNLSAVKPEMYDALVAELEVIGDAT